MMQVEPVKCFADTWENDTTIVAHAVASITKNVELYIKEFFELKSDLCTTQQFN